MYDNIGEKIKGLAKGFAIVGAVVSGIIGSNIFFGDDDKAFIGVLVVFLGPIASWISSWMIYGFGELLETANEISYELRESKNNRTQ